VENSSLKGCAGWEEGRKGGRRKDLRKERTERQPSVHIGRGNSTNHNRYHWARGTQLDTSLREGRSGVREGAGAGNRCGSKGKDLGKGVGGLLFGEENARSQQNSYPQI